CGSGQPETASYLSNSWLRTQAAGCQRFSSESRRQRRACRVLDKRRQGPVSDQQACPGRTGSCRHPRRRIGRDIDALDDRNKRTLVALRQDQLVLPLAVLVVVEQVAITDLLRREPVPWFPLV